MGAQVMAALGQQQSNPYATQAGMAKRRGNTAAGYHGAGSGSASRSAFMHDTSNERAALHEARLRAMAQALGGMVNAGAGLYTAYRQGPQPNAARGQGAGWGGDAPGANQPGSYDPSMAYQPDAATQGVNATVGGMSGAQGSGVSNAPIQQRYMFMNGMLVPMNQPPQQQNRNPLPER